jgi:polyhydroxybutyrate depolymerase
VSSPFAAGQAAPPRRPRRGRNWWIGVVLVVAVLVVSLVLVVAIQAAHRRDNQESTPTTATTVTTAGGSTTTPPTTRKPAQTPTVTSACTEVPQAFPLAPRGCILVSPPNVQPGEKLPLIFVLHGFTETAVAERSIGFWDAAVVKDRFIAAFPQGDFNSWNAGGCCALAKAGNIDDMGYLQALVTQAKQRPDVDPARIFMVGESNGGMMTYRFLCQHADELAGAASVEGTSVAGCEPNAPIRLLHVHGRDDTTVPYDGGQSLISWVLGVSFASVPYSVQQVATAEGCGSPSTQTAGKVTTQTWTGCGAGGPVQLVSVDGWGHSWPTGAYDTTTELLRFFGLAS